MDHETLASLIAAFARRPDALACRDPGLAFGACGPVSRRFAALARTAGAQARIVRLSRWADGGLAERVLVHDVVVVDDIIVDWSARQFIDRFWFGYHVPDLAEIPVPCLVRLEPDGSWPSQAFARAGVQIWDEAEEIVGVEASLDPEADSDTPDWPAARWGARA